MQVNQVFKLVAPTRAMSREESRYPEPENFKPERFLTADGQLNPDASDPYEFVFGFGRRYSPISISVQ